MINNTVHRITFSAVLFVLAAFITWFDKGVAGGYVGSASSGESNSKAAGDTTKILVRHASLPNTAATDSTDESGDPWVFPDYDYDVITEADDGTAVRWGCIRQTAPNGPYFNANGGLISRTAEDNNVDYTYAMIIAFNVSALPPDCRVEDAFIYFNEQRFGDGLDLTTGYIAARLDTIVTDYAMITSSSGDTVDGSDDCYLNTSYDQVNVNAGQTWTPPLGARDDWHDYGASSVRFEPGYTVENMGCIRLDVTDALQQLVDRGNAFGGWAVFWIYTFGTPLGIESFMFGDGSSQIPTGNPCLTATITAERGDKAWGQVQVPIVLGVDDGYVIHAQYRDIMDAAGKPYSEFAPYVSFHSVGGALLSQAQRDSINETPLVDLVLHSRNHLGFGMIFDDHEFDYELARDWTLDVFTNPRDTTTLVDFGWPGAGSIPATYSMQGVSRIIANGYRSARTATGTWSAAIGEMTPMGLDRYVNMYAIPSMNWYAILGRSTEPFSVAVMRDTLMDYLDKAWTDNGRAPLIIYGHRGDSGENGTYEMVSALVDCVNEIPGVDFMSFRQVVTHRLSGQTYLAPGEVTVANGATYKNGVAAAMYDSVMAANSDEYMLRVWIGPIADGQSGPPSSVEDRVVPESAFITSLTGYPNPFNAAVTIRYVLTRSTYVTLNVYDLRGRWINTVFQGLGCTGTNVASWNGQDHRSAPVASGTYFCAVCASDGQMVLRLELIK